MSKPELSQKKDRSSRHRIVPERYGFSEQRSPDSKRPKVGEQTPELSSKDVTHQPRKVGRPPKDKSLVVLQREA